METTLQLSTYEQKLMVIVRALPTERVAQILDYARYIQSQNDGLLNGDETEDEIRADEAYWNSQFEATQDGLKKMADKVRAEIRSGRTMSMLFTKEGKMVSG